MRKIPIALAAAVAMVPAGAARWAMECYPSGGAIYKVELRNNADLMLTMLGVEYHLTVTDKFRLPGQIAGKSLMIADKRFAISCSGCLSSHGYVVLGAD